MHLECLLEDIPTESNSEQILLYTKSVDFFVDLALFDQLRDQKYYENIAVWHVDDTVIRRGKEALVLVKDDGRPLCYVYIHNLKGTQGLGTADAERLKVLSDEHRFVLNKVLDDGEAEYYTKDMFELLKLALESEKKNYNHDTWKRIISELLNWDCFGLDMTTATYRINTEHCQKLLDTGEFSHYE